MNFIKNIKTINIISNLTLRKWLVNPKIYVILIYIFIMIFDIARGIETAESTIFIFPYLLSAKYNRLLILLGAILLFCDAPFKTSEQLFVISRTNKTIWTLGQIFHIIKGSFLYYGFIFLLTIVLFLPTATFDVSWEEAIRNLHKSGQCSIYLSDVITTYYSVFWAVFHSFFLNVFLSILFGILMFFFSTLTSKFVGITVCAALTLAPYLDRMLGLLFKQLMPTNLVSLYSLDPYGINEDVPKLWFAYLYLLSLVFILSLLSIKATKKNLLGGAA